MNILFRLFGIENPFLDFDSNVKKLGWSRGCWKLIEDLGLNVKLNLKNFPKKGAVLIYSNHPTGLDPYILGKILARDDFIFLGDLYQSGKGEEIAKHIAATASIGFWGAFLRRRPTNWPGYINMRKNVPPFSQKKARKINRGAILDLVRNLIDGHVSVVFPSGGEYEFLPWKGGLVKVIMVALKKEKRFTLYRVRFKKFSELKLFFHFLSGKRFFSTLEIKGYPVSLKKNYLKLDEKKLTSLLKDL